MAGLSVGRDGGKTGISQRPLPLARRAWRNLRWVWLRPNSVGLGHPLDTPVERESRIWGIWVVGSGFSGEVPAAGVTSGPVA